MVLGGGFAGIAAVRRLTKDGVDVTLVDQHPYGTFQPLLYQVATAGLNPGDVVYPLRSLTARTRAHMVRGRAVGLDVEAKHLVLADERTILPPDTTPPRRSAMFTVPTVDLAPYVDPDPDPDARRRTAAALDEACRTVGFVQVVGHGVPDAVADGLACRDGRRLRPPHAGEEGAGRHRRHPSRPSTRRTTTPASPSVARCSGSRDWRSPPAWRRR